MFVTVECIQSTVFLFRTWSEDEICDWYERKPDDVTPCQVWNMSGVSCFAPLGMISVVGKPPRRLHTITVFYQQMRMILGLPVRSLCLNSWDWMFWKMHLKDTMLVSLHMGRQVTRRNVVFRRFSVLLDAALLKGGVCLLRPSFGLCSVTSLTGCFASIEPAWGFVSTIFSSFNRLPVLCHTVPIRNPRVVGLASTIKHVQIGEWCPLLANCIGSTNFGFSCSRVKMDAVLLWFITMGYIQQ